MIVSGYGHHGCMRTANPGSWSEAAARGRVRQNIGLSRFTVWGVGGPARRLFEPLDIQDLARFLGDLDPEEPLLWLGLGSNLLVRDGGFAGTVIRTTGLTRFLTDLGSGVFQVGAGVSCPQFARSCAKDGYEGAEFLAGIPGTIGGALAMNAGAFGAETWDLVDAVEIIDRRGNRRWLSSEMFKVSYRHVDRPGECWFTSAKLRLTKGDSETSRRRIRDLLAQRAAGQPSGARSCGSVFRNPPGDHAGRLVEAAGLKGYCIGGAQVSERHANFIINRGNATAADIEFLIAHVREVVLRAHGVQLVPEVHAVGESVTHGAAAIKGAGSD